MSTKPKAKRGRKPKKEIIQIHGKDESNLNKNINNFTSLDEILGESLSVYSAKDSDEYAKQLSEMNMTDLQSHAYKLGLIPTEDRRLLTERLIHEYAKWKSKYGSNIISNQGSVKSVDDLDAKALKILREGA